jgi:hypothetical protein
MTIQQRLPGGKNGSVAELLHDLFQLAIAQRVGHQRMQVSIIAFQ